MILKMAITETSDSGFTKAEIAMTCEVLESNQCLGDCLLYTYRLLKRKLMEEADKSKVPPKNWIEPNVEITHKHWNEK